MSANAEIRDAIKQIVLDNEEIYSVVGTVSDIDEGRRICNVTPISDNAEILGVRLQASLEATEGFVCIPEDGSKVVVTFLNKNTGVISLYTEIDKILINTPEITMNGGDNGGLINIGDLVDKINQLEGNLTNHITSYNTHTHNAPQAPTGTLPTLPPLIPDNSNSIIVQTQVSDIEDDKITH